jgi:hypothetical protein
MSEPSRIAAISAFLVRHRNSPLFRGAGDAGTPASPPDVAAAEKFTTDLEALGPTFIKIGQMLSTRPDLAPPEYITALRRLQDKVAPADLEEIEAARRSTSCSPSSTASRWAPLRSRRCTRPRCPAAARWR